MNHHFGSSPIAAAIVIAAAMFATSCAVNPATGRRQLMTVSEKQEIDIGKDASLRVREEYGLYTEKHELTAYVASVGRKVAARSDRPGLKYQFEIVDSPDINAFALPGGFVYATRGILARMNSEDELAAVLGHETAHIAARHSAAQISKAQAAQLGMVGLGSLSDPRYATQLEQLAGVALVLAFQGYSRDDERQADELGTRYAKRAGYNPRGAIDLMRMLGRLEKSAPTRVEMWLASHPQTSERLANIGDELNDMRRNWAAALALPIRRDEYLQKIDGLPVGWVSSDAFVSGSRYVNKVHDYSLLVPTGWTVRLKGPEVVLERPSEGYKADVKVQAQVRTESSAGAVAREYAGRAANDGLELSGSVSLAGLPAGQAGVVPLRGKDSTGKPLSVRKLFLLRFDRLYVLTLTVPEDRAAATQETFMKLGGSLKFLGAGDIAKTPEPRLALYRARAGETWKSIAESRVGPKVSGVDLAAYNGQDTEKDPEPGFLMKIPPASAFE